MLNDISRKISDTVADTRQAIKHMIIEDGNFSQQESNILENETQEIIRRVASEISPPVSVPQPLEPKIPSSQLQFKLVQNEIRNIKLKLDLKERKFSHSVNVSQYKFDSELELIYEQYQTATNDAILDHQRKMNEMNREISRLKGSLGNVIEENMDSVITTNKELKEMCNNISEQFKLRKSETDELLQSLRTKEKELEQFLKENKTLGEKEKRILITNYENQIQTIKAENETKIKELKEQIQELSKKLPIVQNEQKNQLDTLTERIQKGKEELDAILHPIMTEQKVKHEKEIDELIKSFNQKETELEHEYDQMKTENTKEYNELKSELLVLTERSQEIHNTISTRLSNQEKQLGKFLKAKEEDYRQLQFDLNKQIEQINRENEKEILDMQHQAQEEIVQLEQNLIQTVTQFEQKKKRLESELVSLKRSSQTKKVKPPNSATSKSPRRHKGQPRTLSNYDIISQHFQSCDMNARQNNADVSEYKSQRESELRISKARVKTEKDQFNEFESIVGKEIKEMQQKLNIDPKQSSKTVKSERISTLENNVQLQANQIEILKDELQRLRVEASKRKTVRALQVKHKGNLKRIQEEMQNKKLSNACELRDKIQSYNEVAAAERQNSEKQIIEAENLLSSALTELKRVQLVCETESYKSQQKWYELRNDIAESTLQIVPSVQDIRPKSSKPIPPMRTSTILPPLHNE